MLYYKDNEGQRIFSACNGMTASERAAAGWREFVTEVPDYPRTEPTYFELAEAVKGILHDIEDLTDEEALEIAALYPTWISKMGKEVAAGERLWYNEKLWKVIQAHIVQESWTPDTAVSLFVEVSIEEWPEIPEIITAENAWKKGEKGTWKGQHYESLIDNNTWNPEAYPAGWKKC